MKSPKSLMIEPMSWAAGVFEACAILDVWTTPTGLWRWRIRLVASLKVANKFAEILDVRLRGVGTELGQRVHPDDIEQMLARLLPVLTVSYNDASVIYRLCLTRLRRKGFNAKAPRGIVKYRAKMMERFQKGK